MKVIDLYECSGCGAEYLSKISMCDCMMEGCATFTHYRGAVIKSKPVYQMKLVDGSPEQDFWIEVSEEEYNTPLVNPNDWAKRTLYEVMQ